VIRIPRFANSNCDHFSDKSSPGAFRFPEPKCLPLQELTSDEITGCEQANFFIRLQSTLDRLRNTKIASARHGIRPDKFRLDSEHEFQRCELSIDSSGLEKPGTYSLESFGILTADFPDPQIGEECFEGFYYMTFNGVAPFVYRHW
jgi:hypothetical protein